MAEEGIRRMELTIFENQQVIIMLGDILPTLTASCTARASSVTLGYCLDISREIESLTSHGPIENILGGIHIPAQH